MNLRPLDVADTGELILHRLRVAGFAGDSSPFTPDAVFEIHKHSNGYPRLISQYADSALMIGFGQRVKSIDGFLIHSMICDMNGEDAA